LNGKPCNRISQSRGLELFSKLYVKSKDEIVEKPAKKTTRLIIKLDENENNFETHRITPIEKKSKAKIIFQAFQPKEPKDRKCHTIQNFENNSEPF